MQLTEAERIQLETELLLRHVVIKLRADGGALLKPRAEAPLLLVARTELWPHDGCEQVEVIWRYSRHVLLDGDPVRRGTLTILPLFGVRAPALEVLLACHGLPEGAPAKGEHATRFHLLVEQVAEGVAQDPQWDDFKAEVAEPLPAGRRKQLQAVRRQKIEEALAQSRGNVTLTARRLRVPLRTLWNHIERLEIDTARFRARPL